MLIEKIELRQIKLELVSPFQTSYGIERFIEHIILRIDTEGLTGWGECVAGTHPYYTSETNKTARYILKDYLIPKLVGKEIPNIQAAIKYWTNIKGHNMAKAGLEGAVWDLFARQKEVTLSNLMGGTKEQIDVGVSIGIQNTPEELVEIVSQYISQGYRRIKLKIEPDKDIQFISAIRKKYPEVMLQVDANSAYSLNDIALFKKLDEYDLLLIEQPLGENDFYEHSILQTEINTPICLDESINSFADMKTALELGSCRIINIKPGKVGGFTEAIKIHDYCLSKDIPVWCGGMLETGIGRAGNIALASLPGFTLPGDISASNRYFIKDILMDPFQINSDGTLTLPVKKGIGVNVDEKFLNSITTHKEEFRNN